MNYRRAFTMMEILVVITIIAVLASIAIPTIGLVKRALKDMQCGHNLQQIGVALEAFKQTHDGQFPFCLSERFYPFTGTQQQKVSSLVSGDGLLVGQTSIFICPREALGANGETDILMGRSSTSGWGNLDALHEPKCSYLYEVGGQPLNDLGLNAYFLKGYPASTQKTQLLQSDALTWVQAKGIQLRTGNFPTDSTITTNENANTPFPADKFPIVRCFHHHPWASTSNQMTKTIKKVKAVSWNLNVFECSPQWENDIDGRFSLYP